MSLASSFSGAKLVVRASHAPAQRRGLGSVIAPARTVQVRCDGGIAGGYQGEIEPEFNKLKSQTTGPSSYDRKAWIKASRKSGMVRNKMKDADWDDLEFIGKMGWRKDCQYWMDRVKPLDKKSAMEMAKNRANYEMSYAEMKRQVVKDTAVLLGGVSLMLAAVSPDADIVFSYLLGGTCSLTYVFLLAQSVENVKANNPMMTLANGKLVYMEDLVADEDKPNEGDAGAVKRGLQALASAAAPLRFFLLGGLVLATYHWADVREGLPASHLFEEMDLHMLPVLAGFFTNKGALLMEAFRNIRGAAAMAGAAAAVDYGVGVSSAVSDSASLLNDAAGGAGAVTAAATVAARGALSDSQSPVAAVVEADGQR